MNAVASVLMLAGGALTLIAAVGVTRFPDAVTRLHAATKAASVGIALVLAGAGAALGLGPFVFLGLVAVFQVLTAPVAAHVLGRAVTRESEPARRQPPARLPVGAQISALTVVWLVLWGDVTAANVTGGLFIAGLVTAITRPRVGDRFRLRPIPALRFGTAFLVLLVRSTIQVAAAALGPRWLVDPTVRRVRLGASSIPALVAAANAVSLTPGTLTLAVDAEESALVVHLIRPDDSAVEAIITLHSLAAAALPVAPQRKEARDGTGG